MKNTHSITRRALLQSTTIAAPLDFTRATLGMGGAAPPSDRVRLGVLGQGPRGRYVLGHFLKETDVQVVASVTPSPKGAPPPSR